MKTAQSTTGRFRRAGALNSVARTAAACSAALAVLSAGANETDQYLLPSDKPFADVGRCVSGAHYNVLVTVTGKLNEEIRRAQEIADPRERRARLDALHSPRRLANMVRGEFGPGFFETLGMESSLRSGPAGAAYPGDRYIAYKHADWIYSFAHLPIDPRNLPLLVPSSTVRVYDHYVGTDKFGHFHDLGHYYFCDYLAKRNAGKDEDRAVREVVGTYSRGLISETTTIGFLATGVCSNADLMANYMGMKFYRNLTEPVMLQRVERPPMLVLVGEYWQLNLHVRPDSDFFAPFVSDHWNEALNPCVYEWGLRSAIKRKLRSRSEDVLSFYCGVDNRPREAGYFARLAADLATYYGEDYGYYGDPTTVMSIATTCFGHPGPDNSPFPPSGPFDPDEDPAGTGVAAAPQRHHRVETDD